IQLLLFVCAIITVLERIYEESPCVGNITVYSSYINNGLVCNSLYDLSSITENTTDSEMCSIVKGNRNCDSAFIRNACGDLYGWLIERFWLAAAEVFFPQCVSDLESDQISLPPNQTS
ncbi:hypothetical protein EGW08_014180, partial [Elysia chlorotica]